jgi:hypothetical protein
MKRKVVPKAAAAHPFHPKQDQDDSPEERRTGVSGAEGDEARPAPGHRQAARVRTDRDAFHGTAGRERGKAWLDSWISVTNRLHG